MKKCIVFLLGILLLTGCTGKPASPTEAPPAQTEPASTAPVTEPEATLQETELETTAPNVPLNVFIPNENADGFETMPTVIDSTDGEVILQMLIENSMLNEDIRLNSLTLEGRQLNLDFNQAFADQLCSYGTAGERMLMGCIVNTYLSVFDADSVYITVDGQIVESGHVIYDFPLGYFE